MKEDKSRKAENLLRARRLNLNLKLREWAKGKDSNKSAQNQKG